MSTKPHNPILRVIQAAVAALLLAFIQPAYAQNTAPSLDQLFTALGAATTKPAADRIAAQIWHIWFNPADANLAARMHEIVAARTALDIGQAMKLLNQVIIDYPAYAEGWNRRATLHYELGNYEQSLADIAETLAREPRHFGALSGQALVYLSLGDTSKARAAARSARDIHPFIAETPPLSELVEPRIRI